MDGSRERRLRCHREVVLRCDYRKHAPVGARGWQVRAARGACNHANYARDARVAAVAMCLSYGTTVLCGTVAYAECLGAPDAVQLQYARVTASFERVYDRSLNEHIYR